MSVSSGFKISRQAIARREGPTISLPEHGDAQRLRTMSNTVRELSARADYAEEIGKLWQDATEKFLAIGRYLRQAKQRLRHGEYEAMIAADLPFGKHVAWQFKAIAEAVDGGRVREHELPPSYTTAYKLVEMRPEVFARARSENLIRPSVTRREIIVFQRRLSEEAQGHRPRRDVLTDEREVVVRRIQDLGEQQNAARRRLAQIEEELARPAE